MTKMLTFAGMTFGGWAGWWVGAHVGILTAFLLSSAGSITGVYVGWRLARDYLA